MTSATTIQPMPSATPPASTDAPVVPVRPVVADGTPGAVADGALGETRAGSPTRATRPATSRGVDLLVGAGCLLAALIVMSMLWVDPNNRSLSHNGADQVFFEWVL